MKKAATLLFVTLIALSALVACSETRDDVKSESVTNTENMTNGMVLDNDDSSVIETETQSIVGYHNVPGEKQTWGDITVFVPDEMNIEGGADQKSVCLYMNNDDTRFFKVSIVDSEEIAKSSIEAAKATEEKYQTVEVTGENMTWEGIAISQGMHGFFIYSIIPKESIIKDGVIKTIDADKEGKVVADKMMLTMSAMDLQNRFNNLIKENLNGLAYVRSLSTVKMAIAKAFNKYLGISPYDPNNMVFIQRVVLSYQNHFSIILDESIKSYKRSKEEFTNDGEDKYNESWEIPQYQMFNQNAYATKFSTISLHKPLYMLVNSNGKFDSIEEKFVEYLDSKNEFIEWFWHNGQEHMEQNFGIKYNKNSTFQPDFIIKFKNGKIGIFDTKSMTNNILDTLEKAEALQAYLKETNRNDLFGGIIINTNEVSADKAPIFMINSKDKFVSFDNQPTDWEYFDKIFLK